MPPGPAHARQRRRRLLTLIALLLGVSAFSPRLRETFIPPENEREDPRMPRRLADLKLARQAVSPSAAAAARAAADPSDLFAYVPAPGDAKALQERAPVAADEIHYVALNEALVVGKDSPFWKPGGRVTIPLPDGRRVEVVIDHTEALGPDRFTSTGSVVGA
ncbi:MAG TPA: hypothetical protein VHF69_12115, partial [Candidatus Synoicihabitans sp.]|nr:hypothetical protein [Candidatus Synoicihabitans sp.]